MAVKGLIVPAGPCFPWKVPIAFPREKPVAEVSCYFQKVGRMST